MSTMSNKELLVALNGLVSNLGLRDGLGSNELSQARGLYDNKEYGKCLGVLKKNFRFSPTIHMFRKKDQKVGTHVVVPEPFPRIGTPAYSKLIVEFHIHYQTINISFETFITAVTHELSHLVLDSIQHHARRNELAVDMLPLVFGFEDIVKKGRKVDRDMGHFITQYRGGYFTDSQFAMLYWRIKYLRTMR
ncbi:hypothetical protein ACFL2R_00650 [Patescibacteria group bacterium]